MSGRSSIRLSWEPRQLGAFEMSRIGSVRATSLAEYRYRGNCPSPSQAGAFFSFRAPPRSREYPKIVSLWDAASAPLIETRRSKQSCTGAGEPAPSEPLRKRRPQLVPTRWGRFIVGRRACHDFSSSRDHRNQTTTTAFRVGRRQTPPKAPAVRLLGGETPPGATARSSCGAVGGDALNAFGHFVIVDRAAAYT